MNEKLAYHETLIRELQSRVEVLEKSNIGGLRLFALGSAKNFGDKIASILNIPLCNIEENRYSDGEATTRSLENVRRCHTFVIQSAYEDGTDSVDGKWMKLNFFIKGLRQASAESITAVIPYHPYSRQDRKVKSREVVSTQAIAEQLESSGATGVLTIDVHSLGAYQNAFRIRNDNLEARGLFANYLVKNDLAGINPHDICILSPDAGAMGRANRFRRSIANLLRAGEDDIDIAHLDKVRKDGKVIASRIVGEVRSKYVIIIDDMIGSGSTMTKCAIAADRGGARSIICVATHGLFVNANENLAIPEIRKLFITDTIEPFRLSSEILKKTFIIPTTGLFAEAIKRMHLGQSLSSLLNES